MKPIGKGKVYVRSPTISPLLHINEGPHRHLICSPKTSVQQSKFPHGERDAVNMMNQIITVRYLTYL